MKEKKSPQNKILSLNSCSFFYRDTEMEKADLLPLKVRTICLTFKFCFLYNVVHNCTPCLVDVYVQAF